MKFEANATVTVLEARLIPPVVLYQQYAPYTGAQQCKGCCGWIMNGKTTFVWSDGPYCDICWEAKK
jgi:hypothetical protein